MSERFTATVRTLTCSALITFHLGACQLDHGPSLRASYYVRESKQAKVIVFVHGVLGDGRATWTAPNGAFWPDLLLKDSAFNAFDIFVYDYFSPTFVQASSIDELSENLRLTLESNDVVGSHKQIVFLCHSMGGLVLRNFLLKYQRIASRVPMAFFFSSPTTGAEVAALARAAGSHNPQFKDMKVWRDGGKVGAMVLGWHAAEFDSRIRSYCAYETRPTLGVRVVNPESATNLCNQRLDPIDADHIDIVKPRDRSSTCYVAFRQALRETFRTRTPSPPNPASQPPSVSPTQEATTLASPAPSPRARAGSTVEYIDRIKVTLVRAHLAGSTLWVELQVVNEAPRDARISLFGSGSLGNGNSTAIAEGEEYDADGITFGNRTAGIVERTLVSGVALNARLSFRGVRGGLRTVDVINLGYSYSNLRPAGFVRFRDVVVE